MWERKDKGRVGVEFYYTGAQRLEESPFRDVSRPYAVVGLLLTRLGVCGSCQRWKPDGVRQRAGIREFARRERLTGVGRSTRGRRSKVGTSTAASEFDFEPASSR
jgi:hypothetical protein